ncbi:MAG TPA: hypothetical protein VFV57_09640 [Limnobacter sp.]|nr:hypothetical protein [Limnobacter sp.]
MFVSIAMVFLTARLRVLMLTALALLASACAGTSIGPRSIEPARMDYNDAISRSWDQQLLLNLVRVRYAESPLFVDITAINASQSMSSNAGIGATIGDSFTREFFPSAGVEYRDSPVISYNYLQGEAFAKHVLTPLTPAIIEPLTRSGWSAERLLACCVETINGIDNDVPDRERFGIVADLIGKLQTARELRFNSSTDGRIWLTIKSRGPVGMDLRNLLKLDPELERYEVIDSVLHSPRTVAIQGRSVLSVMHALAFAVDVPPQDVAKVTQLYNSVGAPVDTRLLTSQLLRVHSGNKAPQNARVKVFSRDHWFWIEDTDLNSKLTLSLLRMLLVIKSVDRPVGVPVITIPAQ